MTTRQKILIIEDDEFTRFMIQKSIETLNRQLDIDVAVDGLAGCECIETDPDAYSLVFMDIHMPNLSGLDATKRIRSNERDPPRNVPIVAVTADPNFHHPLAVKSHGMDGFLSKPISLGGLESFVNQFCGMA